MHISLADIDILEQVSARLDSFQADLSDCCAREAAELSQTETVLNETSSANAENLAEAEKEVAGCTQQVEVCQAALAAAEAALAAAQAAARSSSRNNAKEEDNDDNSSEISSAEMEVAAATEALELAEAALDAAQLHLARLQNIQSELSRLADAQQRFAEDMQARHSCLSTSEQTLTKGRAILQRKYAALQSYLESTPGAKEARNWLQTAPKNNTLISPQQLDKRLNTAPEVRLEVARYFLDTNPAFAKVIRHLADNLHTASTPMERWQALRQVRSTGTGAFAELWAERALGCYAQQTETQARTYFDGGRYTKTDLILKGLKEPLILGKGQGMYAPKGGSLALEIKCGCKEYLAQQMEHMVFQAGGHQQCDASFTLTTRDILNLSEEKQQEMRDALQHAGSPIIGMLPNKAEMDDTCMKLVSETEREIYGNNATTLG